MTIRHAWPSGTPHNDCLLLTDSSTSNLSELYNCQGDVYRAALCFTNGLAVSEAAPRLDPFGNVLHQGSEREVRDTDIDIYIIYIFLLFKISVFSKISFVRSLLPPGCISFISDEMSFVVLCVLFSSYILETRLQSLWSLNSCLCVCVCVYIWMVFQDCLFYVRKRRGYNRYFFFYFCDTRKTITSSVYEKEFPVFLHSVRFFMTAEDVIIYCGSVNRMSVCWGHNSTKTDIFSCMSFI